MTERVPDRGLAVEIAVSLFVLIVVVLLVIGLGALGLCLWRAVRP